MAPVPRPSIPDPAATALVQRVSALRRRDRGAAAVGAALTVGAGGGPLLLMIALIHRHLVPLGAPVLALAIAAVVVAGAAAVAALRPRSLAATATLHDHLGAADQLLPAALDAALGRRPADPAVAHLLIRQALGDAESARRPAKPYRSALPLFFGLTAWPAAALLLAAPGHSMPTAAITAASWEDPVRSSPARGPAAIAGSAAPPANPTAGSPGPGPATLNRVEAGVEAAAATTHGSGGSGLRRGIGMAPGGATAGGRGGGGPLPIRWQPLAVAGAGVVPAAPRSGETKAAQAGPAPPAQSPRAPASTPPARLLSPGQRLLVAAFVSNEATIHD